MLKLGLIVFEGCYLSSLSGLMDTFQVANAHIRNQQGGNARLFSWQTIAQTTGRIPTSGGIALEAETTISVADRFDVIYLPAFFYQGADALEALYAKHRPLLHWITAQWNQGTVLVSNCTGTFLLAETGLLNARKATTTWWLKDQFRKRYPRVKLDSKALITEHDGLMCAGAMTAYLNMAVHLIERYASVALAAQCAKAMLIDTSAKVQAPYQSLVLSETSGDPTVSSAQYWLQTHLRESVDQASLAQKIGVSQRTLIRRFNTELGMPPLIYLQNCRIEAAKQLLESTALPLVAIIEQVGYSDISSFSRLFKKRTGLTPAEYRRRFPSD